MMIITKNKQVRNNIKITTTDKEGKVKIIQHQQHRKILGLTLSADNKWEHHIKTCKK